MPQFIDHAPYKILSRLTGEKMFNTSLIIFILFKSIFPDVNDMMTIVRHSVIMF